MDTAKKDTVDRVDKYTKKYKPTADKYNKLCVSTPSSINCIPPLTTALQLQIREPQNFHAADVHLSSALCLAPLRAAADQAMAVWTSRLSGIDRLTAACWLQP
jgi:hypothetical protein